MKKKFILLMTSMLLIMSLGGCGLFSKPTTESVLENMQEAMTEMTSIEASLQLDLDMAMSMQGMEIPMSMEGDIDLAMVKGSDDESTTSVEGTLEIEAMGETMEQDVKSFSVTEDGETVNYSWDSDYECWFKEVTDVEENAEPLDTSKLAEYLTLQEDREDYDGKDCFVLAGTVDSDDLSDVAGKMSTGDMADTLGDIDIDLNIKLYVENKTYQPVAIVVSVSEIETEAEGMTLKISKLDVVLGIKSVNSLEEIEIPKEAKDAEEQATIEWEDWEEDEDFSIDFEGTVDEENIVAGDGVDIEITYPDEKESEDKPTDKRNESDVVAPSTSTDVVSSAPWTDMKFTFEGKEFSIFDPYIDFESTGWVFDAENNGVTDDYVLNANEYTYSTAELTNPSYDSHDVDCWVGFCNTDSSAKVLKDCSIWSIDIDVQWAMKDGTPYPQFSVGGLQFGDSEEKMLSILGDGYDSIYHAESLGYTSYSYCVDYEKYLDIEVYPDYGITSISLKCYP